MPKKICSVHELLFDLRRAVFTIRVVHRVGSVIIKDRFDITRNGPDRVSGPFHGLHRLYNRAKRIFELKQCFTPRSFLRGQLPRGAVFPS